MDVAAGLATTRELPDAVTVQALRFTGADEDVLEVDLETPFGDVVVREQHGRLDQDKVSDLRTLDAGGAPVYVVSESPLHLVWQSSDTVVDLVAPGSLDDVLQLVSTFPVDEYDEGFQARVGRGWTNTDRSALVTGPSTDDHGSHDHGADDDRADGHGAGTRSTDEAAARPGLSRRSPAPRARRSVVHPWSGGCAGPGRPLALCNHRGPGRQPRPVQLSSPRPPRTTALVRPTVRRRPPRHPRAARARGPRLRPGRASRGSRPCRLLGGRTRSVRPPTLGVRPRAPTGSTRRGPTRPARRPREVC